MAGSGTGSHVAPTPLYRVRSVRAFSRLFVKDESANLCGTFKDRLSARAVAEAPRDTTFAVISYGNTAVSLAREIWRTNEQLGSQHRLMVVTPHQWSSWILGPASTGSSLAAGDVLAWLSKRATVVELDLSEQLLDDAALRDLAGWVGLPTERFSNITEGLDVPAYVPIIEEAVDQIGSVPDVCLVPFGAGILANEVHDYLRACGHGVLVALTVAEQDSPARMLYGPLWVDHHLLIQEGRSWSRHRSPDRAGRRRDPYPVWRVSRDEVTEGVTFAAWEGLSAEPSGAVGFGVLNRLPEMVDGYDPSTSVTLVINTGNGIDGFRRCGLL